MLKSKDGKSKEETFKSDLCAEEDGRGDVKESGAESL